MGVNRMDSTSSINIKRGDILLVGHKFCPVSWLIQKYLHCKYNHVAWIASDSGVLELKAKTLVYSPLDKFFNSFLYKIKIIRLPLSEKDLWLAEEMLITFNKNYSYLSFVLVAIKILTNKISINSRNTCSTIIASALATVGCSIFKKPSYLITPKDFDNLKVEIIYEN